MTCERFLTRLDGLDNETLPADMAAHARSCRACAVEAEALDAATALYRLPDLAGSASIVPRVSALLPFMPAPRRIVSMRDWLGAGLLLIVSIMMIPLLVEPGIRGSAFGAGFIFPLSLVLGCLVTIYAGLFILSHLDEFSRRLKVYQRRQEGRAA